MFLPCIGPKSLILINPSLTNSELLSAFALDIVYGVLFRSKKRKKKRKKRVGKWQEKSRQEKEGDYVKKGNERSESE